jgi:hypothetical protein
VAVNVRIPRSGDFSSEKTTLSIFSGQKEDRQKTYILKCSNCALYIQFSAPVYRESVKEVWVIPPVITNTVEISEKKRYSSEKGLSGSVNKNTKRGG